MNTKRAFKNVFFKRYLDYRISKLKLKSDSLDVEQIHSKLIEAKSNLDIDFSCGQEVIEQRSVIKPLVSVITPAYNSARFLEELARSLEKQEMRDKIQWVVVNDHSTDNIEEIFRQLSKTIKLKSFKFISLDRNLKTANALNIAANNADAPVLAWVSSDDAYCDPKKLRIDYEMIQNGYDCVFSRYFSKGSNVNNAKVIDVLPNYSNKNADNKYLFLYQLLIRGNVFNGSSSVFRKERFLQLGGFDSCLGIFDQDGDLWGKLLLSNSKVGLSPTMSFYRTHESQNSKKILDMTVFRGLVRIKLLNFVFKNKLDDYIHYFIREIDKNPSDLVAYGASSAYLVNKLLKIGLIGSNSKISYFADKYSKELFGVENMELIEDIAKMFEKTRSFEKFTNYSLAKLQKNAGDSN